MANKTVRDLGKERIKAKDKLQSAIVGIDMILYAIDEAKKGNGLNEEVEIYLKDTRKQFETASKEYLSLIDSYLEEFE